MPTIFFYYLFIVLIAVASQRSETSDAINLSFLFPAVFLTPFLSYAHSNIVLPDVVAMTPKQYSTFEVTEETKHDPKSFTQGIPMHLPPPKHHEIHIFLIHYQKHNDRPTVRGGDFI